MTVTDIITELQDVVEVFKLLDLLVLLIAGIAMAISFFLLLTSCQANIRENSWEFGVYRALGLTKSQMTRIYMYETLVCILAASLIGFVIGIGSALTLTFQFLMFNELPFKFAFPYTIFFSVFSLAILTAVVSSYTAIKEVRGSSIA